MSLLFGTTEVESHDLSMFPKWRHMRQAFEEEEIEDCHAVQCGKDEWQAFVESLRGKDLMTQLRETNVRMNEERYIADDANWALPDYWATPFEFLRKAGGDCEDYAIAKYMMLRDLGVSTDDMRIVVLKDLRLRVDHAVLAVYINATPFILDSRYPDVVPASSIVTYQPIYSINEHGWWLHRRTLQWPTPARAPEKLLAARMLTTKMPAAPAARVGARSTFAAQLASLPTVADAIGEGAEIQARYSAILKGSDLSVRRVDLGAKGIWYRVLADPFGSRINAGSICTQLRTANPPADCIVIAIKQGD